MIRLEPRRQHSTLMVYLAPVLAVLLTLLLGVAAFALMGKEPLSVLHAFFVAPVSTRYGLTELGVKATPLILIGVGLALAFRANVWNIGAEGQLTIGAILGGGVAIYFHESDSPALLPAMLVVGVCGGVLWAAVPAWLKTRFNANEILTSLMLTYVALLLLSYLVHGPWRDPAGYNFPESRIFPPAGTMPLLVAESRLHFGLVLALLAAFACWLLLARSFLGFQLRVIGLTPRAARYAGFSEGRLIRFALMLSGGLAGLAGVSEVAGPVGQLLPTISPGYGFTAIIVAFLGRLHPLGVVPAGLVMALTYLGGEAAQITVGLPAAVTGIFQGVLLFFLLACDVLTYYRLRIGRPPLPESPQR